MLFVVLALARQFLNVPISFPENRRVVPRTIERRGPAMAALQFGFELGTGTRTYVTANAPYIVAVGVILLASVSEALLTGIAFGGGRALMVLLRVADRNRTLWDDRLKSQSTLIAHGCTGVAAFCVLGLLIAER